MIKKLLLALVLIPVPHCVRAATQIYIPSTSTYHNYTVNIESASINNVSATTATIGGTATFNGAATFNNKTVTIATSTIVSGNAGARGSFQAGDGTASTPSYGFLNQTNTGIYRSGANTIAFTVNGTDSYSIQPGHILPIDKVSSMGDINNRFTTGYFVVTHVETGTVATPSYSFRQETNSGFYLPATNQIGMVVAGSTVAALTSTTLSLQNNKITNLAVGTAATDAVRFSQISGQRIIQVVTFSVVTASQTTNTTDTPTLLTISITPGSTASHIFILATGPGVLANGAGRTDEAYFGLYRGSTNLNSGTNPSTGLTTTASGSILAPVTIQFYDAPSTVAATTYTVRMRVSNALSTVVFGDTNVAQYIMAVEVN